MNTPRAYQRKFTVCVSNYWFWEKILSFVRDLSYLEANIVLFLK